MHAHTHVQLAKLVVASARERDYKLKRTKRLLAAIANQPLVITLVFVRRVA